MNLEARRNLLRRFVLLLCPVMLLLDSSNIRTCLRVLLSTCGDPNGSLTGFHAGNRNNVISYERWDTVRNVYVDGIAVSKT